MYSRPVGYMTPTGREAVLKFIRSSSRFCDLFRQKSNISPPVGYVTPRRRDDNKCNIFFFSQENATSTSSSATQKPYSAWLPPLAPGLHPHRPPTTSSPPYTGGCTPNTCNPLLKLPTTKDGTTITILIIVDITTHKIRFNFVCIIAKDFFIYVLFFEFKLYFVVR